MNQMEIKRKQILLLINIPILIYLALMFGKVGDKGAGFFMGAAYICLLFSAIFFLCLPDAMEKLLRTRISKGQYKNADRMWRCALVYGIVAGALAALILILTAGVFTDKVMGIAYAELALKCLAPAFLISGVTASLKGYFQGLGTGMPTVIAEGAGGVASIIFGVIFEKNFWEYGTKVAALLQNPDFAAMYGAAGIALGFSIGSIFGLLFLVLLYMISDNRKRRKNREGMKLTENYLRSVGLLFRVLGPYMVLGFLVFLPIPLGVILYQHSQENPYESVDMVGMLYGNFGLIMGLLLIPILAGCIGMSGKFIGFMKKEEYRVGKFCLQASVFWTVAASSFVTALFVGQGEKMAGMISQETAERGRIVFQAGGVLALFGATGVLFMMMLWDSGRVKEVLLSLGAGCVCYVLTGILSLNMTNASGLSLIYGELVKSVVIMAITGFVLFRHYHFTLDWLRGIFFPLFSAGVSGLIMFLMGKATASVLSGIWDVLVCGLVGLLVHLVLVLILRCVKEKDYAMMPGGRLLVKVGKVLHLF